MERVTTMTAPFFCVCYFLSPVSKKTPTSKVGDELRSVRTLYK
jgi:hypothetical protein